MNVFFSLNLYVGIFCVDYKSEIGFWMSHLVLCNKYVTYEMSASLVRMR